MRGQIDHTTHARPNRTMERYNNAQDRIGPKSVTTRCYVESTMWVLQPTRGQIGSWSTTTTRKAGSAQREPQPAQLAKKVWIHLVSVKFDLVLTFKRELGWFQISSQFGQPRSYLTVYIQFEYIVLYVPSRSFFFLLLFLVPISLDESDSNTLDDFSPNKS